MKRIFLPLIIFCCCAIQTQLFGQCATGESSFELTINADNYPEETSWELADAPGTIIYSGSMVPGDTGTYFQGCIAVGACYTFTIFDMVGDGICCNYGTGNYEISLDGAVVITSDGDFGQSESAQISCSPGTSCTDPFAAAAGTVSEAATLGNTWYTFVPAATGMYDFNTCGGTTTCGNTTIWIYDYCSGLDWDDTNEGAINYSDDDCLGQLSSLSATLEMGVTYYLRVKYDTETTNCTETEIDWTITYNGPVTGCTDPNSCNFSPLATADDGSCIYPGDPGCPDGPDLIILHGALESSMYVAYLENNDACLIQEGCVAGYGQREVIRFTTHIKNIGTADYYIGQPQANDQWEWDPCHGHWHYEGYAEYVLYEMETGNELPIGFKNGFCVMDLECNDGGNYQYGCGNQGISKQCGDIYDASLQCQWIDITDVAAGEYMLVVKVNWDQSADALGQQESDYQNNWTQVCISITRDPITSGASFNILTECEPYEDCLGVIYGNAQPDCEGTCAGVVVTGDINSDAARTVSDLTRYMLESLMDTMPATACLDLNADGEITVTDATLLYDCVLHGNGPTPGDHNHTPCEFPYAVQNPTDEVTLSMGDFNEEQGYFDVHIKNPFGKILSFQFGIGGAEIDFVTNHIQDYFPNIMYDEDEIIGVSYDESIIDKHNDFVPFLRVHYSAIVDDEICITDITDFVNDDHEEMVYLIGNACISPTFLNIGDIQSNPFAAYVMPNPISNEGKLVFDNGRNEIFFLEIMDITGRRILSKENIRVSEITLNGQQMDAGIYIFKLSNGEKASIGRFVVDR